MRSKVILRILMCNIFVVALGACTEFTTLQSQTESNTNPRQRSGSISAAYPQDIGIANDPDVILYEGFEDSVDQIVGRFESFSNQGRMALLDDPAPNTSGRSIQFRVDPVGDQATDLYTRFAGQSDVYIRFYVKAYQEGHYHHTGARIGGYNPSTPYPQGHAGLRPVGDDRVSVAAEISNFTDAGSVPPSLYSYSYWNEMRGNPSSDPTGGENGTNYWGNSFLAPNRQPASPPGEWIRYEFRVRLNTSGTSRDGTYTLWRNGTQVIHMATGIRGQWVHDIFYTEDNPAPFSGFPVTAFEGFRWRTSTALQLNYLQLANYSTQFPNGQGSRVQFDQVVVARNYIGCAQ